MQSVQVVPVIAYGHSDAQWRLALAEGEEVNGELETLVPIWEDMPERSGSRGRGPFEELGQGSL